MRKITAFVLFFTGALFAVIASAPARSPLGTGISEPIIDPSGPFSFLFLWIQSWQSEFEQALSEWLVNLHQNPYDAFWLVLLSFFYGVLHAAGPGHGKAIVASYLIANNELLKRGILLSFLSSLLQAITAIFLVLTIFFLLPAQLTRATSWLTAASFALIMFLGLGLLIRKTPVLFAKKRTNIPDNFLTDNQQVATVSTEQSCFANTANKNGPTLNWKKNNTIYDFSENRKICTCRKSHAMPPVLSCQRSVLTAIISIGIRPCTGAVFIMSFAVLNKLFLIGCISVLAMSLGTFITVSILALVTVNVKNLVLKIAAKTPSQGSRFQIIAEWIAALFIFISGCLLFVSMIY